MATIPEEVKKIIGEHRAGFIAATDKNGAPNASPRGSLRPMDDEKSAVKIKVEDVSNSFRGSRQARH